MRNHKTYAFTLVELLVVIGIIALLISILLPALNRARAAANTVKCASNLRSVGQGIALYASNYKGAIPAAVVFSGMHLVGGHQYGPGGTQGAADIWSRGHISWSSQVFTKPYDVNDPIFGSDDGWQIFTCPRPGQGRRGAGKHVLGEPGSRHAQRDGRGARRAGAALGLHAQ